MLSNFRNTPETHSALEKAIATAVLHFNAEQNYAGRQANRYDFSTDSKLIFQDAHIVAPGLIASEGPKRKTMGYFLENTVFNPNYTVNHVIALGRSIHFKEENDDLDFHDYCVESREDHYQRLHIQTENGRRQAIAEYAVQIKNQTIEAEAGVGYLKPVHIGHSKLKVQVNRRNTQNKWELCKDFKTLNIVFIPVDDNGCIEVGDDNKIKKALWDLYEDFMERSKPDCYTLVHSRHAEGAGELILIFDILRNYEKIFADDNELRISIAIHRLINEMRRHRAKFISDSGQLANAMRIACQLKQYSLENKPADQSIEIYIRDDSAARQSQYSAMTQVSNTLDRIGTFRNAKIQAVNALLFASANAPTIDTSEPHSPLKMSGSPKLHDKFSRI